MSEQNQNQIHQPEVPAEVQAFDAALSELQRGLNDPNIDIAKSAGSDPVAESQLVGSTQATGVMYPRTEGTVEAERQMDEKFKRDFNRFSPEANKPIPDGSRRPGFLRRAQQAGSTALENALRSDGSPAKWR